MTNIIISVFVVAAFAVAFIYIVIRRGLQMRLLVKDGVETTGVVMKKLAFKPMKGGGRIQRRIHYVYQDANKQTHEHRSLVTLDFWNAHDEHGPIAIIYSQSRPEISAPKELVETCREAVAKK